MEIEQIKKYWKDSEKELYTYFPSKIDNNLFNNDTLNYLTTCGFPADCAPYLRFSEVKQNTLQTPNHLYEIDIKELETYLIFGGNGSGDPLCIDRSNNDRIVYLNHDNDFEPIFINESILKFATSLIKYRDFVKSLVEIKQDSIIRRKFSKTEFEELQITFNKIDPKSLIENSFWGSELDNLVWERDNL